MITLNFQNNKYPFTDLFSLEDGYHFWDSI